VTVSNHYLPLTSKWLWPFDSYSSFDYMWLQAYMYLTRASVQPEVGPPRDSWGTTSLLASTVPTGDDWTKL